MPEIFMGVIVYCEWCKEPFPMSDLAADRIDDAIAAKLIRPSERMCIVCVDRKLPPY